MKKMIALFVVLLGVSLQAQTTVNLQIQWNPNPAADNVTAYNVTLVNAAGGATIPTIVISPGSACSPVFCVATFNNIPMGNFTASVTATNEWGTGLAGQATITIVIPSQVQNVRGKKG